MTRMSSNRLFLLVSTALASVALSSGAAWAQSSSDSETLETIVVSANRMSSLETKTAVSMQVLTAEKIASKGITDIQSLTTQMPAVNFANIGGEAYITMRGIGSQNVTETGDPAVPISVDGFSVNRPYVFNNTLYDVSSIEVLHGPQGTLYGRNATGGAVNVFTNKPTKDFEGYAELGLGTYDTVNAVGALNIPLSDTVQVRAAFSSLYHGGYVNNGAQGFGNDQDSKSGRIQVAIQPVSHLNILLTAEFTHVGGTGLTDLILPLVFPSSGGGRSHSRHAGAWRRT